MFVLYRSLLPTLLALFLTSAVVAEERDYANELPRIAPSSAADGLASLNVKDGYRVDLIAAEPLVVDPVAMCFDPDGRLYVVEMRDYSEQDQERLGRVRMLEDRDQDGKFDHATIFSEGLSWPTAIIAFDGGVFVGAPPLMLYLRDNDGDLRADEQRVVFEGFSRSNVQGMMNSLRWGLDHRIHGATGTGGARVTRPDVADMAPVDLRGRDFSFDPRQLDIRAETGGAQHGMCFDDWGRKYCCSNSDHIQFVTYDQRYASRFPLVKPPRARASIASDGPQAQVFRTSPVEPWRIVRTRLRVAGDVPGLVEGGGTPAGYFTGATGTTIYRGDAMPNERGRAFVADVGSNLVHRKQVSFDAVVPVASRIDPSSEFLTSTDIWFRPVQFANGPDGALHILDMSREVIEHPKSLPDIIKKHLDLTSGRDQGRLFRIVPTDFEHRPTPWLSQASDHELVELLAHENAWHRETAAQLLFERQATGVVPELVETLKTAERPFARLHALSMLEGLERLSETELTVGLRDPHPRVRELAIKLSEKFVTSAAVREALAERVNDEDPRVRLQLGFSLGELPVSWRVRIASQMLEQDGTDGWIRFAVFTSLSEGAGRVVAELMQGAPDATTIATAAMLAELVGLQADDVEVGHVLRAAQRQNSTPSPVVEQLVAGIAKSKNKSASTLLSNGQLTQTLDDLLAGARRILEQEDQSVAAQTGAVRTLALGATGDDVNRLLSLLEVRTPVSVQLAVLETLASLGGDLIETGAIDSGLIDRWDQLGPQVRREAIELLLSRPQWTDTLLTAIESETLGRSDWDAGRLRLHLATGDDGLKQRLGSILDAGSQTSKADIVDSYRGSLTTAGDVKRGGEVFLKSCATCHRVGEQGHAIGPNLATLRNRGSASVLVNVLDPNREVNPEFVTYVVITDEGRTHTGIITEQSATSLTLRRAEGREETIPRASIESMQSTGQSLMPEGLEKSITVQQMADLLAFVNTLK